MSKRNVIVVDDERIVAGMLAEWLSTLPLLTVAGIAHTGKQGLELCRKVRPDLAILDIEMPEMDGLALAAVLREELPATRIIILSSHCDPYHVYQISRLRIHGYLEKTCDLALLERAIADVLEGRESFSERFQAIKELQLKRPDAYYKLLSPRELMILMQVVDGASDEAIAARLQIAPSTVATHRRNLRSKLDAHNDRDLVHYAREWGLVSLNPLVSSSASPDLQAP